MTNEDVKQLLESALSECDVQVQGDGSHFDIIVVGDVFEGLRPLKKQQLVYGVLNEKIADGSIHAVNMKTFTRAQWAEQNA